MKKLDGRTVIEHSGEVSGFVSENVVFPGDRAAIVVLTNEMATQAASMIADRVAPMILGSGLTGLNLPPIARINEALRVPMHIHPLGDEVLFDCDLSAQRKRP